MQSGTTAARHFGYYSEQEFSFAPYEPLRPGILELGRASIDREHRTPEVLTLLWRGIAQYANDMGLRYLIGCSSLNSRTRRKAGGCIASWSTTGFRRSLRRSRPRRMPAPSSPGRTRTAVALPANRSRPNLGSGSGACSRKGTQAAEDLSGHRRAHWRAAGLGPRVRHHRFSYPARSEVDLAPRRAIAFWPRSPSETARCPARCGAGIHSGHLHSPFLAGASARPADAGAPRPVGQRLCRAIMAVWAFGGAWRASRPRRGWLSPTISAISTSHSQRGHALFLRGQGGDRRLAVLRQGGAQRGHPLSSTAPAWPAPRSAGDDHRAARAAGSGAVLPRRHQHGRQLAAALPLPACSNRPSAPKRRSPRLRCAT